jgi:murein DD-endopeptidase MepM/ murein hydrolase activator NlpD
MLRLAFFVLVLLSSATAHAQSSGPQGGRSPGLQGGYVGHGPMDHNHEAIDAAHRASVRNARALGLSEMVPRARLPTLDFPLRQRAQSKGFGAHAITNFVDLDVSAGIRDFSCSSRTYDGHNGTDIMLAPFAWRMMDAQDVEIVAAAPGVIVNKQDGNFDRQCSMAGDPPANFVVVRQDDGLFAYYWHMKNGSVTSRPIGRRVEVGTYLGLVGSSGRSTGPHLHFETRSMGGFQGLTVDPFAGACGAKGTKWRHQAETFDTEIIRVATHNVQPPNLSDSCANPDPGFADTFANGARVYTAVYLRDQRTDTPVTLTVRRPNGQVFSEWTTGPIAQVFPFRYWYGWVDLPASGAEGRWTFSATIEGKTLEHVFMVGSTPQPASLRVVVDPASASATPRRAAKFKVTVRNTGTNTAVGCSISLDAPVAATWTFEMADTPEDNTAFDIPAGMGVRLRLTIRPKPGFRATTATIPIHAFCNNAAKPATAADNVITLSF